YEQAPTYRRTLVLVDVGVDEAYLVDVFRVQGGSDHVLSLHGQDGTFEVTGVDLPEPVQDGTLAGSDIAYGQLYDDPVLGKPDYHGAFNAYHGSGYSHLFNWQSIVPTDPVTAHWTLAGQPKARFRVHLPPHPGQEMVVADAYASPRRIIPAVLKYILLRRPATPEGNTFVVVWELAKSPIIDEIVINDDSALGTGKDQVMVLTVRRGGIVDTIAIAPEAGMSHAISPTITSDAAVILLSRANEQWGRRFAAGGTRLSATQPDLAVAIPPIIRGPITAVRYAEKTLTAEIGDLPVATDLLVGHTVRVFNDSHSAVYSVGAAQRSGTRLTVKLGGSDVFTGRLRLQSIDAATRRARTPFAVMYPFNVKGMSLVTADYAHSARIVSTDATGSYQLAGDADIRPFAADLAAGKDTWIADYGVGDQIEVERSTFAP
ncbi:MAG TPA: hypothetical protein VMV94_21670, partial [Phycisphaerae bacterium]|nr:hypothetical protein [Phycisphaerae bacterium]